MGRLSGIGLGVACATVVLGVGVFTLHQAAEQAEQELLARSEAARQEVSRHVAGADAVLSALASLYQASEELGSAELTAIAEDLLAQREHVSVVAHLTWVAEDRRLEFEEAMLRQGFTGFRIREPATESGRGAVASRRGAYLPVRFIEPFTPQTARLIGVDLLAEPRIATAVERAIDQGTVVATSGELLPGREPLLLLARATYYGHYVPETVRGRREQVSGVFLMGFDAAGMLARIQVARSGLDLRLAVSGREVETATDAAPTAGWLALPAIRSEHSLDSLSDDLVLRVVARPTLREVDFQTTALVMALAAVGVTVLLTGLRHREAARRREREAQEALFREKELAEVTLQSIGDGVVTADNHGRVQYLNPVAEELTGWLTAQAVGRDLGEVVALTDEASGARITDRAQMSVPGQALQLLRRDGVRTSVDHTLSELRDPNGETIGNVLVIRDVSRERELANELAYQASHDPLTDLPNRRHFERTLQQLLAAAPGPRGENVVCYLDLDQFKVVNDTCGHVAGDQLLRQIADVLRGELRDIDLLARLGGDEFGILLRECGPARAGEIAERLRSAVASFRFLWEGRVFDVSASIGVVPIDDTSRNIGDVQRAADLACYAAKDLGRNCVHVFQPGDEVIARRHTDMQWHSQIKQALEENRFELHWQVMRALSPLRQPAELREFLVRMRSPDGDIVPPMAFIPAAERYGLMGQIDRWVIDHAFAAIREASHPGAPAGSTLYTINLSGQSMVDETLADHVLECLGAHRLPGTVVCFEITETAAISNFRQASAFIERMRASGVRFALDDFGAGLSSFGYLKNLPVDFLKIDGQFVRDIVRDPVDFAMVKSIVGIGQVLNIHTVAERVEDESTLDMLRGIGVDYAQGYHVGRPEPVPARRPATCAPGSPLARPVAACTPALRRVV
ncbi:MAG: EAL domain-containing protein [Ectothiorhodospiraceae bacterium]|nr:EAL domain-containing protein [Ectothiorhodospiraceae bacterium]